jgi:hypothetical protein
MNRSDLQSLSRLRLQEARVLLANDCFEGAYYLAGYAVECALKACIAKQVNRYDFPDRKLANDSYSHNIEQLLGVSGLKPNHDAEIKSNPDFAVNWAIVKDWSEQDRYRTPIPEAKAKDLYSAITARRNGVIAWLKKWW